MADADAAVAGEFVAELAGMLEKPQVLGENLDAAARDDFLLGFEPVAVLEPFVLEHFHAEEREAHTEAVARHDGFRRWDLRDEIERHDVWVAVTHRLSHIALGPVEAA